jgi:hypothetical protein
MIFVECRSYAQNIKPRIKRIEATRILPIIKIRKVNSKENTANILSLYFLRRLWEIGFPHDLQFFPLKDNVAPQCSHEIKKPIELMKRSPTMLNHSKKRPKKTSTTTNSVVSSMTPAMKRRILLTLAPSNISTGSYFISWHNVQGVGLDGRAAGGEYPLPCC